MYEVKNFILQSCKVLFICLVFGMAASAQDDKIRYKDGLYEHKGKKYELKNLGPIIANKPEALFHYMEGKQKHASAKTLGVVSITSLSLGLLTLASVKEPESLVAAILLLGPNIFLKSVGILSISTGVICGLLSLSKREASFVLMRKGARVFNANSNTLGYRSNLRLGLTNNGVGFTFNF